MLKILIIDDTRSVHAFIKSFLSKVKDIHATSVYNGAEAMELFKKDTTFHLILLDWEMPMLNGPETLEAIKKEGISIPVIMMTTKNNPKDIKQMLNAGIAEYMMKPFTFDILVEKIETISGKNIVYAA